MLLSHTNPTLKVTELVKLICCSTKWKTGGPKCLTGSSSSSGWHSNTERTHAQCEASPRNTNNIFYWAGEVTAIQMLWAPFSLERAELRQTALRHYINTDRGHLPREMGKLLKIRQFWINKLWNCLNNGSNSWTKRFEGLKRLQKLICHHWYQYLYFLRI